MHDILIVEDDPISAAYLKKILVENGFSVCGIEDNADGALQAIRSLSPALVLIDVMLYGPKTGCELALEIRRFDPDVILIFLSAHSDDTILDYVLDVNAHCYLLKPYRDNEIVTTLKMALNCRPRHPEKRSVELENGYRYHLRDKKLFKDGSDTLLSGKPLQLIGILARCRGSVVSYEQLFIELYEGKQNLNTLRSLVYRIKRLHGDLQLQSISKKGYVLH